LLCDVLDVGQQRLKLILIAIKVSTPSEGLLNGWRQKITS